MQIRLEAELLILKFDLSRSHECVDVLGIVGYDASRAGPNAEHIIERVSTGIARIAGKQSRVVCLVPDAV